MILASTLRYYCGPMYKGPPEVKKFFMKNLDHLKVIRFPFLTEINVCTEVTVSTGTQGQTFCHISNEYPICSVY